MELEFGLSREWLVANGLGGYSSSTILCCNTRKYHGLLVASLEPPVKRRLLLSKLEEEVVIGQRKVNLSTNEYQGTIHPDGYIHLRSFEQNPHPKFTFDLRGVTVIKRIFMPHGQNSVVISYQILNPGRHSIKLIIKPFITSRGIHEIGVEFNPDVSEKEWGFLSTTSETYFALGCRPGEWTESTLPPSNRWYRNFHYRLEKERGYPSFEDLYCPGEFSFESDKSAEFNLIASGGNLGEEKRLHEFFKSGAKCFESLYDEEMRRIKAVSDGFKRNEVLKRNLPEALAFSADSFIVERQKPRGKSIIAGYHWFTDYGRDTFISLPGLTLVTGRFEDARKIISTYNEAINRGLVPNNFSEEGTPYYHGVDSSLWYIYAIQKYLEYTGDNKFVKNLLPSMKAIINGFNKGNELARVMEDGLISISKTPRATTWMDVNIGNRHVTPRIGKVVEINALWFNALRFVNEVLGGSSEYNEMATMVQDNYDVFWNDEKKCLYDYVYEDYREDAIRPNQIFSLSLPYSPMDRKKGERVVAKIKSELLTPYGLRSLERGNEGYRGVYTGDSVSRDIAYHQGTVWSWLMGPFVTAHVKAHKRSFKSKMEAEAFLKPILAHLSEAGIGTISEIFDGDPPYRPRGCISQAWSLGEVLRTYCEDILELERPF